MGFWEHFPYTNFHEINLDWIIKVCKSVIDKTDKIDAAVVSAESAKNTAIEAKDVAVSAESSANSAKNSAIASAESASESARLAEEYAAQTSLPTTNRFIFIGDSYGVDATRDGVAVIGWAQRIRELLGMSENDCYTSASSGAGFTQGGVGGLSFLDQLNNIAERVTAPGTITKIFVIGGANDANNISGIATAINTFVQRAKALFPNANVIVGFCGRNWYGTHNVGDTAYYSTRIAYERASCGHIYNLVGSMPVQDMFTSDGIHPNNTGEVALCNALRDFIVGGSYMPIYPLTVSSENGMTIACFLAGEILNINCGFYDSGQISATTNNIITIGRAKGMLGRPAFASSKLNIPCVAYVGSDLYEGYMLVQVEDDMTIKAELYVYKNGVQASSGITRVVSRNYIFTIPSIFYN